MIKVAASLLAAPPLSIADSLHAMERAGVDMFHMDIMDGVFVPNISFGMDTVAAVHERTAVLLDVHLMIVEPERYLESFAKAGSNRLTVHVEACENLKAILEQIRQLGMQPGVSLRPATELCTIEPYLPWLDNILVMTVNPGFGGQKLLLEAAAKIAPLRKMLNKIQSQATITVDGGVTMENAAGLVVDGADVLVLGTALVRAENPDEVVRRLHALAQ